MPISRRDLLASLLLLPAALRGESEWIPLFNGRSLDDWKPSESRHSFRVEDGKILADGPRAHLFYSGRVRNASFKNFELKAEVLTRPGACSGIYFHTRFQNPTFLPDVIARDYDRLWTAERMQKVIDAAKANDVAIEINNRYRLPSAAFIKRARNAGVKFSFGTNNADRNLGRMEYAVAMVKECGLTRQDIFVPKPDGDKAAQRRKAA